MSGTIFPHGLLHRFVDCMNNKCKMCISVRRNHTSYSSTYVRFILARIPIFLLYMEMIQEASFLFLIFSDINTILHDYTCTLSLQKYELNFISSINVYHELSRKMWLFLSNCQTVYILTQNVYIKLSEMTITYELFIMLFLCL